jgi:hypothetical protein
MTTILAELKEDGALQSIELPAAVRERITAAPADVLQRPQGV